jgi:cephalosporin-C deacetylase-like acetyl esterase
MAMRRREFVTRVGAASLSGSLLHPVSGLAAVPESYDKQFPDMIVSYMAGRLNRLSTEWDQRRTRITTASALEEHNRTVRQKVVNAVGGFPERNPLGAKVVKVIERPGYRVENVMFRSRPNFSVTGNLYIPAGASRLPGIISPCGHYPLARMLPSYQLAYLSLVKSGFVVLAFDPIGQGERRQYWNPATGITEVPSATYEHSMPGQLQLMLGDTLTGYLMWDAMRAIDYLITRPEVDPTRIGCTGHSGGGTLTMFTSAVDERIRCVAVHEGGTRNRWPMRVVPFSPLGPSDVEQNLFPGAAIGIDNPDLLIAIAPRPLMATIEHFSPGFDAAANTVRERYKLLGVGDRFSTVEAGDPHAWTHKLRLATADWFSRWFYQRPGPTTEPELTPERPQDLRCFPNGSILHSRHGETVWTDLWSKASKLPPKRTPPATTADVDAHITTFRTEIRSLLQIRNVDTPLDPRPVETVPREAYKIEKLAFASEPSIYIPTWVFQPQKRLSGTPCILYFNESGKDSDGMEFENAEASGIEYGVLATLARRGYQVIAADVRGIGETRTPHRPNSSGNPFAHLFDSETALAYMAWFMDSSLFGMRVQDVLRTVDYALSRLDATQRSVWIIGKDMGALWALYAAALDPRIEAVVCHGGLMSYRALTDGIDRYLHGANVLVPSVLRHFDLPHVAGAVAGRLLALLSPVDAMKRPVPPVAVTPSYAWTKTLYGAVEAGEKFRITSRNAELDLASQYIRLLGDESHMR